MQIYLITNNINGKIYVGRTKQDLRDYFSQNLSKAIRKPKDKPALYNAIRKYGRDNFEIRTLRVCETLEDANIWEKFYIKMLSSQHKDVGYNIKDGGDGAGSFFGTREGCRLGALSQPIEDKARGGKTQGLVNAAKPGFMSSIGKAGKIEDKSKAGKLGGIKSGPRTCHLRWHVKRNIISDSCVFCQGDA